MIDNVAKLNGGKLPNTICFRYNPGDLRECGSEAAKFGNPGDQKYGVMDNQIIDAYKKALSLGATDLRLHTMIASGTRDITYIQGTIEMLLNVVARIKKELGVEITSINMGGGIGIPYKPEHNVFPIKELGQWTKTTMDNFKSTHDFVPDFHMECGRCVVGPYGILVSKVRGIYNKGKKFVGLNVSSNANPRPKDYGAETDGYHHILVVRNGKVVTDGPTEVVTIVGSLCENSDVFALDRELPVIKDGDTIIILCTGAHAIKMGNRYNSQQLPGEIMLTPDQSGFVEIRRREKESDHDATLRDLNPNIVPVS
jgi:diaminopimelate decarboxylase